MGSGFWPAATEAPPDYDDVTEQLVEGEPVPDVTARVVRIGWTVMARPDAAERLAARRAGALDELERQVSTAISAFVPSNRDLAYGEKQRQALIVQAGGAAGQALSLEAAARGIDVPALAAMVIAKASAWDQALGQIEALRLALTAQLATAASGAEITRILAGAVWPVP